MRLKHSELASSAVKQAQYPAELLPQIAQKPGPYQLGAWQDQAA